MRGIRDVRFTPEADMLIVGINVCYVPKADILRSAGYLVVDRQQIAKVPLREGI